MADRPREPETYKGKKKRRLNVLGILAFVLVLLIAVMVVVFYSLQKYIVYGQDGVTLEVPFLMTASPDPDAGGSEPGASGSPDEVTPEVVIESPDYSSIEATAGEELPDMKALFVPADYITNGEINKFTTLMPRYGADSLVLELKPVSGQLVWNSAVPAAQSYGLAGTVELSTLVNDLKTDKGYRLAALINCCQDTLFATRNSAAALPSAMGGIYADETSSWLNPYNTSVRQYISDLCVELAAAGFDEIILRSCCQPDPETAAYGYPGEMSFTPTALIGVSGLAVKVASDMQGRGAKLDVLIEQAAVRTGTSAAVGQDLTLFFKIFDRLCCWAGTAWDHGVDKYNVDQYMELGELDKRFMPLMPYAPDDFTNWIIRVPDGMLA